MNFENPSEGYWGGPSIEQQKEQHIYEIKTEIINIKSSNVDK